jgi:hypothetical protein
MRRVVRFPLAYAHHCAFCRLHIVTPDGHTAVQVINTTGRAIAAFVSGGHRVPTGCDSRKAVDGQTHMPGHTDTLIDLSDARRVV